MSPSLHSPTCFTHAYLTLSECSSVVKKYFFTENLLALAEIYRNLLLHWCKHPEFNFQGIRNSKIELDLGVQFTSTVKVFALYGFVKSLQSHVRTRWQVQRQKETHSCYWSSSDTIPTTYNHFIAVGQKKNYILVLQAIYTGIGQNYTAKIHR